MIGQSGIAVKNVKRADAAERGGTLQIRRRHHSRGHGPDGPVGPIHAADLSRGQSLRYGGDNFRAPRRQLDAARRRRSCCRPATSRCSAHHPTTRRHVRRSAGDVISRPRRHRLGNRCRLSDTADLRGMQFPVWARAVHGKGTVKATVGSVNTPIICAAPWCIRAT